MSKPRTKKASPVVNVDDLQSALTPDVTEMTSGYPEARGRLAQIFANLGIGKVMKGKHTEEWYLDATELGQILDYVKSHTLLSSAEPPLIRLRSMSEGHKDKYINIDDVITAIILDSIIGEGNYKLNYLQSLRHMDSFINDNWYRVVDKLQWLLFDRVDSPDVKLVFSWGQ